MYALPKYLKFIYVRKVYAEKFAFQINTIIIWWLAHGTCQGLLVSVIQKLTQKVLYILYIKVPLYIDERYLNQ